MSKRDELDALLDEIYADTNFRHLSLLDSESHTEQSYWSDTSRRQSIGAFLYSKESLEGFGMPQLLAAHDSLKRQVTRNSQILVRELRRRDHQRSKVNAKCNMITAILQALSAKRSVDAQLNFSLTPNCNGDESFTQWLNAMRSMNRLPDGIPHHFRRNLWLTLANEYLESHEVDFNQVCAVAFADRVTKSDEKLGAQIIKDVHRTGWAGRGGGGAQEQQYLKRVLLAYARHNPKVGYCQGFNVIGSIILHVMDHNEKDALKVLIYLLEAVVPNSYFDAHLRALTVDMAVLGDLLHKRLPTLSNHLQMLQVNSECEYEPPLINVFTMQWMLTLFATCLPRACVLRVWDSAMLDGNEILLRTALAIWAKCSRRVCTATSCDEYYEIMGLLCQKLQRMPIKDCDHLISIIYVMCEFPYPGLPELRDKYTFNIQPFKSTLRSLRAGINGVWNNATSNDSNSDSDTSSVRSSATTSPVNQRSLMGMSDINALKRQYKMLKQRQKQAAIIIMNVNKGGKSEMIESTSSTSFNHLSVHADKVPMESGVFSSIKTKSIQPSSSALSGSAKLQNSINHPVQTAAHRSHSTVASIDCDRHGLDSDRQWQSSTFTLLSSSTGNFISTQVIKAELRRSQSLNITLPDVTVIKRCYTMASLVDAYKIPNIKVYNFKKLIGKKKFVRMPSLIEKSRKLLDALPVVSGSVKLANFNPFPVRVKSKLIESEKIFGLYK